jgi:hypothetical protein
MQDFISANLQRTDKFKLALWNLVQWDQDGTRIDISDSGEVEPFGTDDPDEWGCLGWVQDWCIRPADGKSLLRFSQQRRIGVYKYTHRLPLAEIYKIEDAKDYAICPRYYCESPYRFWNQYVKTYLDSRKSEREFWYSLELLPPPTEYSTDKDVIAILLLASQFTSQTSPKVKPTFAEILALNQ